MVALRIYRAFFLIYFLCPSLAQVNRPLSQRAGSPWLNLSEPNNPDANIPWNNHCVIFAPDVQSMIWIYYTDLQPGAATTIETIVHVVNKYNNSTRTDTITNANLSLPFLNSARTKTAIVSVWDGSQSINTTLTYPTVLTAWGSTYQCSKSSWARNGSLFTTDWEGTLPSNPPPPSTNPSSTTGANRSVSDPRGWLHSLSINSCNGYRAGLQPFFPSLSIWNCVDGCDGPPNDQEDAFYLTYTTTSTDTNLPSPTSPEKPISEPDGPQGGNTGSDAPQPTPSPAPAPSLRAPAPSTARPAPTSINAETPGHNPTSSSLIGGNMGAGSSGGEDGGDKGGDGEAGGGGGSGGSGNGGDGGGDSGSDGSESGHRGTGGSGNGSKGGTGSGSGGSGGGGSGTSGDQGKGAITEPTEPEVSAPQTAAASGDQGKGAITKSTEPGLSASQTTAASENDNSPAQVAPPSPIPLRQILALASTALSKYEGSDTSGDNGKSTAFLSPQASHAMDNTLSLNLAAPTPMALSQILTLGLAAISDAGKGDYGAVSAHITALPLSPLLDLLQGDSITSSLQLDRTIPIPAIVVDDYTITPDAAAQFATAGKAFTKSPYATSTSKEDAGSNMPASASASMGIGGFVASPFNGERPSSGANPPPGTSPFHGKAPSGGESSLGGSSASSEAVAFNGGTRGLEVSDLWITCLIVVVGHAIL